MCVHACAYNVCTCKHTCPGQPFPWHPWAYTHVWRHNIIIDGLMRRNSLSCSSASQHGSGWTRRSGPEPIFSSFFLRIRGLPTATCRGSMWVESDSTLGCHPIETFPVAALESFLVLNMLPSACWIKGSHTPSVSIAMFVWPTPMLLPVLVTA